MENHEQDPFPVPAPAYTWAEPAVQAGDVERQSFVHGVENENDQQTMCGVGIPSNSRFEVYQPSEGRGAINCPECLRIMSEGR